MPAKKNANGEGSVYQRADGRWCGAAYVTTTDGTTKRIHVYGDTHREASDKLAAKIADSARGTAVVAKDPNLTVERVPDLLAAHRGQAPAAGDHVPQLRADDHPLPDPRPRLAPVRGR